MPEKVENRNVNITELVKSAVMDADNEVRLHVENVTDLANKDKDDFFSVLSRYQHSEKRKGTNKHKLASLLDTAGFTVNANLMDVGADLSP